MGESEQGWYEHLPAPLRLAASDGFAAPMPVETTHADLDLRAVRCFLVLVEEGQYRRAAARLNVSQPGLSRVISSLEQRAGAPLIDRETRPFTLTHEGEIMAIYGRLICQLQTIALREVARASEKPARRAASSGEE
jgi:DNA-binding transcriptional LysR family regulator